MNTYLFLVWKIYFSLPSYAINFRVNASGSLFVTDDIEAPYLSLTLRAFVKPFRLHKGPLIGVLQGPLLSGFIKLLARLLHESP